RGQRGNPPNWDIYRRNLEAAAQIGRRWLEAAPDEAEAHYQYGLVLMGLQRFSDAASEFAAARRLNLRPQPGAWALEWQIECLFQADSVSRRALPTATALLDSLARGLLEEPIMTRDTAELQWVRRAQRASHAALSGSPSRVPERIGAPPWNPRAGNPDGWFRAIAQLAAGSSPRNLDAVMARLQDQGLPPPFALAWNVVGHLCAGGLCSPQGLSENAGWRASALALALAGQTDSARAVLRRLDSTQTENERFRGGSIEMGFRIAVSHLALGDTAGALAALSRVARLQPFFYVIGLDPAYPLGHHAWVLGRVWLLHADLLRATGRTEDSHLYYRRVADLWSRADPEIRVFADRARAQLPDWMRQP
ncbi:MAG TPA: tetratricopeptide repeat protein, partial [Gemmatimonadales bacterium]|nr:tetratricopeptide repeat protein [Gemmatimonadales bacterium]